MSAHDLSCAELEIVDVEHEGLAPQHRGIGGEKRGTEAPHEMPVGVHDHLLAERIFERAHHAHILRYTTLEHHRSLDLLPFANIVKVVRCHGTAQPGNNISLLIANLQLMHQVALSEDRAPRRDVRGLIGGKRYLAELLHLDAQTVRLARKERTGAGGAQRIHGIVHGNTVLDADDLRVLAADLENRTHIRMQEGGTHRMGRDLVLDHLRLEHRANEAARRTGGAD